MYQACIFKAISDLTLIEFQNCTLKQIGLNRLGTNSMNELQLFRLHVLSLSALWLCKNFARVHGNTGDMSIELGQHFPAKNFRN